MATLCHQCQYIGDKHSFPMPNNLIGIDPNNPTIKHFYCCCGDSECYGEDVTDVEIKECECFDAL